MSPLRSVLDSKESDLQAALQQLEGERVKEQALQSQLEEERLQHMQREGQSAKTLEVRGSGPGAWAGAVRGIPVGIDMCGPHHHHTIASARPAQLQSLVGAPPVYRGGREPAPRGSHVTVRQGCPPGLEELSTMWGPGLQI